MSQLLKYFINGVPWAGGQTESGVERGDGGEAWDEMERKIKDLEENNIEEIKLRSVVEEGFLEKVEELRELEKEYRDLQAQNRELRTKIDQSGQANDVTLQQSSTAGSVEEPAGLCITLVS